MAGMSRHVFKPIFEMSPFTNIPKCRSLFYSSGDFFQTFYKNKHSWDYFSPKLFFIVKQIIFPLSKDSSTAMRTCQDTVLVTSTCPLLARAPHPVICFIECLELIWCHVLLILHSLSSRNSGYGCIDIGKKKITASVSTPKFSLLK